MSQTRSAARSIVSNPPGRSSTAFGGSDAMSGVRDRVWADAEGMLAARARLVARHNPAVTWQVGHSANEAFPFRLYVSFSNPSLDDDYDERLVVSVDCYRGE